MALSTQTYKGARDFYPEDKRLQKYIFNKWRETAERFGYEEYDGPIIEPLEIYKAKTGQEIVNEQTYLFTDRGGREVVIRPEMTPTVSRLVAKRRQELAYPLRWYSIPNLWRYERPQKGRLREHWQLNVDIFGVSDVTAELEVIQLIDAIFKDFGASHDMYEIRLNHRGLVNYLLTDHLKLSDKAVQAVSSLIDRYHKLERTDFISKLDGLLTAKQRQAGVTEQILEFLSATKVDDLPKAALDLNSTKELKIVLNQLKQLGMSHVRFDPTLMRGFDYYTGLVFEVFDSDPSNNRSMLGGGRYDGLVGLFGVAPIATVGFGWGDVTLLNFLNIHRLLPDLKPETDLYVALIGDVYSMAEPIISKLRQPGLKVAVDLSGKKIGEQLKVAGKKTLENVLIIGEDEISSGKLKLKNLKSGQEKQVSLSELVKQLKN